MKYTPCSLLAKRTYLTSLLIVKSQKVTKGNESTCITLKRRPVRMLIDDEMVVEVIDVVSILHNILLLYDRLNEACSKDETFLREVPLYTPILL